MLQYKVLQSSAKAKLYGYISYMALTFSSLDLDNWFWWISYLKIFNFCWKFLILFYFILQSACLTKNILRDSLHTKFQVKEPPSGYCSQIMECLTPKFNLFHDKLRGLLNRMSLQGDLFKLFMIMLLYYAKICFVHII